MIRDTFTTTAIRLAGFAGARLGWTPDAFWRATPAELVTIVAALIGPAIPAPPDPATIARLRQEFPDD